MSAAPTPTKPPPIIVGVAGIDAAQWTATAPASPVVNWRVIHGLPAFQMFLAEIAPPETASGEEVWHQYVQWHAHKGYWPHETPDGKLKEAAT
jgi:hypothetical protein